MANHSNAIIEHVSFILATLWHARIQHLWNAKHLLPYVIRRDAGAQLNVWRADGGKLISQLIITPRNPP